jgi:hypothetical protein
VSVGRPASRRVEGANSDPRTLTLVPFFLHELRCDTNSRFRRFETSPIVTIDKQTQVRPPVSSTQSAPILGKGQPESEYTTAQSMLPKKRQRYRDNRDLVLEILQTTVSIISDVNNLLPVGVGAITSKLLDNVQVMASCYNMSFPD